MGRCILKLRKNKVVSTSVSGVVISYYDKNGEKLALVSNLARKQQKIVINLPAGTKQVVNAENNKVLPSVNNMVTLNLPRNDFGFIIIKK